ncbi:MAG: hypothetical protein COV32_00870 [Candidatus Yonathbacteria bacterium CG10_big_fil_rev_8_21_14_0_10_43_136]|uniref:Uncharacterized protein n=2 Tax=Parcubacteria group TaxID=1794811 RepID=A0A2M7Q5F6_9BACT|nr:MAG: hypothetical protein AUK15_01240 [Candidatus Nomurabacteria bacterium CG2_30_43_9]PIR40840.1 MAG: hypothetical protein COV32_00870 [Candidatus Yonathbacteria bacterium CG10_big_fil_rev_8_21_14_0_10_43_136]PIX57269.1 MAG: hypothetical protein COZ48_01595 [Candidatus Yonathbacteria bacterium CG_4_10_14_3_um_filter_43_12]PIY58439.1 MAG: hypothetical protein COY98_01745 [Candidatus Yonathbacteria bacterium CG_4_10_14_0_8_um_filter_43_17]
MCFSATASFVAGTALSATGAVTLAETKKKSDIPFASLPFLFGIQQFIEGGVWLSFQYGLPYLNQIATYSFMLFAYIFWPVFIPFAVGLLETDSHRKKILYAFQFVGLAVGSYLLYFIVTHPAVSQVVNKSIVYTVPKEYGVFLVGMYLVATCVSCLFSTHRIINLFGVLAVLSLAIAYYFFTASYVSVWCFFAAILSIVVYLYFRDRSIEYVGI